MKRKQMVCHKCGKEFVRATFATARKYCSPECAKLARYAPRIKKYFAATCDNCGSEYQSYRTRSRFCSTDCRLAWWRRANEAGKAALGFAPAKKQNPPGAA